MDTVIAALFFALFFGGMGWFIWSQIRKDRRLKAELDALCAARGWQIDRRKDGRRPVTEIAPADGAWQLRLSHPYRRGSGKNSPTVPGQTEFRSRSPAWASGRAMVGQRMPGGMDQLMGGSKSGLAGFFQHSAVKSVLSATLGQELVSDLTELRPVPPPPGVELTLLASSPPEGLDWNALQDAIHGWTPVHSRERTPPSVRLGPDGFALRLSCQLSEVEDIVRFVDHASDVAARLGTTPIR
jgi:hypothetical protein